MMLLLTSRATFYIGSFHKSSLGTRCLKPLVSKHCLSNNFHSHKNELPCHSAVTFIRCLSSPEIVRAFVKTSSAEYHPPRIFFPFIKLMAYGGQLTYTVSFEGSGANIPSSPEPQVLMAGRRGAGVLAYQGTMYVAAQQGKHQIHFVEVRPVRVRNKSLHFLFFFL